MNTNAAMPDAGHIKAIAFDLDGTLVDSAPDIAAALATALRAADLASFDLNTVRTWIGDGPDALIGRALERSGLPQASVSLRTQLRRDFDTHTLAAPLAHGMVFPGIAELLQGLHGRLPMVVVTNKPTPLARAVLGGAKLLHFVSAVYGADTPALRKPAPAMLLTAAAQLQVRPDDMLMVGDGHADLESARRAGCTAALVAWGYGGEAIAPDVPAWRIQTPQQLEDILFGQRQRALSL